MTVKSQYDFHLLGWHSFQQLCLSITREILGQTVESFLDTNDGGRDGAFCGIWKPSNKEEIKGRFVIQCKFFAKRDATLKLSNLKEEIPKIRRLVKEGRCDCYVIISNAGISGQQAEKIENVLLGAGVKSVLIFGAPWLSEQINQNQQLRMSIPRLYGIGDLSQILDARAYAQARVLLSYLKDDLAKIVVTSSYKKASEALDTHGFVLLIGEPAAGKTTIASMLAMAALDKWGAFTLKLDEPGKIIEHWNPDNPSQLFWIDDAFGVTQYELGLTRSWNHILPQIRTMLKQGVKIVMTSRDYIYNGARNDLKEGTFPLLEESQVVIDVHDLSLAEKKQILYNHLKLGKQPKEFLTEIKQYLDLIAGHPRFIPETARRISDPIFTHNLYIAKYFLEMFVEKQEKFLQEVVQGLDKASLAALALIYMRNGELKSPIDLKASEKKALSRMASTLGECIASLKSLNGSLVQFIHVRGNSMWRFKHPTIGDSFGAILVNNPELLEIYVRGTAVEKLLEQVTCGNVNLKQAVIIPKDLFPIVLDRLTKFSETKKYKSTFLSSWSARRQLHTFLSRRCSKRFLSSYIKKHPRIFSEVLDIGSYLHYSPEIDLILRLHKIKLLPDETRKSVVDILTLSAIQGKDLYALDSDDIRIIFTNEEFENLRRKVYDDLVPELTSVRINFQSDFNSDDTAEEYMERFIGSLKTIKRVFESDPKVERIIDVQLQAVEEWVSENTTDVVDRPERKLGELHAVGDFTSERSIFDDIDK